MSNRFENYNDPVYLKSINQDKKSLLRKIRDDTRDSPYLNFDIAEFIIKSEMLKNRNIDKSELDKIIMEAIFYFKKGDKEAIKDIIITEL